MGQLNSTVAREIGQAAIRFELQRTGHLPQSLAVIVHEGTLVITLHEALSPAERALAKSDEGAAQIQEFHRRLFASSSDSLRQEINRITGLKVCEASADLEPTRGAVTQAFPTGTIVQVFLLDGRLPTDTWSGQPVTDDAAERSL